MRHLRIFAALLGLTFGLSGCVVYDDEPVYVHHSYDSYKSTIDYYHRPPRYYDSHYKHKHYAEPKKPRIDIHKHDHAKKPEPIKKHEPVKDKVHHEKEHKHHDIKKDMDKKTKPVQPKKLPQDKIRDKKTMEHHDFKKVDVKNLKTNPKPKPKHFGGH